MVVCDNHVSTEPDLKRVERMQEARKPEEISTPRHADQPRPLREVVVEMRTDYQILKAKSELTVYVPAPTIEAMAQQEEETVVDDAAVRALKRLPDSQFNNSNSLIRELRRGP